MEVKDSNSKKRKNRDEDEETPSKKTKPSTEESSSVTFYEESDHYMFYCPWCKISVYVAAKDIRCTIFRCGEYKDTHEPIPPHSTEVYCKDLVTKGLILGCGKPFKFDGKEVTKCGYI